jgi:hypothetical protein
MRKFEKSFICMLLVGMLFVVGCGNATTTVSYTYTIETGDSIIISLNTNDGYSLSSDIPFVISKDKEEQSQGTFIEAEYYSIYVDSVENDENAEIIDQGEKDNCSYVMWNYGDSEYDYVIMINGTNTGILLGNNVSEESAKECFDRLTITVKE